MTTYTTQKTRIATEMVREDLESGGALETVLDQHYADAVEHYQSHKFWFNTIRTTVDTVASTATVSIPSTVRVIDRIRIDAYDRELEERTLDTLPDYSGTSGPPRYYAYYNDLIRLHPVPDAVYTLTIYGISKVAAPTTGSDDNIWTNEAARLIRAHTKMTLYRGQFRDEKGTQLALAETEDALRSLRRETAQRLETKIRAWPTATRYNINTD